jgi:hypothetical protein
VHLPHHLVDNAGDERLAEMAEFLSCRAHPCADVAVDAGRPSVGHSFVLSVAVVLVLSRKGGS